MSSKNRGLNSYLTSVGTVVISEGIKFLYGQASELLKRLRDRKDQGRGTDTSDVEPVQITLPALAFEGQLQRPEIHYRQLEKLQGQLYDFRKALADHADGLAAVNPADMDLMSAVDALRQLLEAVFGQRITFKGEKRDSSGPVVEGEINVDKILGDATAVKARLVRRGSIKGRIEAGEIAKDAKATAIDIDIIGD